MVSPTIALGPRQTLASTKTMNLLSLPLCDQECDRMPTAQPTSIYRRCKTPNKCSLTEYKAMAGADQQANKYARPNEDRPNLFVAGVFLGYKMSQ
jgi:hypothetical protein